MSTTTDSARGADALMQTVGVRPRSDLSVLRLRGDDQRSWLNGQVTCDVRHTRQGDGVYGLVVSVKGRILADVWVLDAGDALLVALPAAALDTVRAVFESQIIMEDVELESASELHVLSVQGPRAELVMADTAVASAPSAYACGELEAQGFFVLTASEQRNESLAQLTQGAEQQGGGLVDDAAFDLARLRAGRPRFGDDFGEHTYPQEAGLKGLAVSFNKGCYVGQEVVCTLEHRGKLSRRLLRLESIEGALTAGDELRSDAGEVIGRVTSAAYDAARERTWALGLLKLARAQEGSRLLTPQGTCMVLGPAGRE